MTNLRERRKQMLHDEIIEASQSLMAEKGYSGMSMEELAARVGVSKPTLYKQFPTKEDLVVAVTTTVIRRQLAMVETADSSESPLDHLCTILYAIISLQAEKQRSPLAQLRMPELMKMLEDHPETLSLIRRLDAKVVQLVQAAIEHGEIDPAFDVAAVARVFHGMVCAMGFSSEIETPLADLDTIADTMSAIFRRGVAR